MSDESDDLELLAKGAKFLGPGLLETGELPMRFRAVPVLAQTYSWKEICRILRVRKGTEACKTIQGLWLWYGAFPKKVGVLARRCLAAEAEVARLRAELAALKEVTP